MTTPRPQTIAVGYDGSSPSAAALDWAAVEASRRDASLLVICVVGYHGMPTGLLEAAPVVPASLRSHARELSAQGAARAAKLLDDHRITTQVHTGSAAAALVSASNTATLLVVGNRRRGELGSTIAGSVRFAAAAHAHCPVVVVPEDIDPVGTEHGVLVGVDGSPSSDHALTVACDIAARSGAPLTILAAWDLANTGSWVAANWEAAATDTGWPNTMRAEATSLAEDCEDQAHARHPDLEVRTDVRQSSAADALISASKDAELVVVGSRGRGGFASLVLGSVSHAVMHRCACPVMIVRS